jgi:hypothetical protein
LSTEPLSTSTVGRQGISRPLAYQAAFVLQPITPLAAVEHAEYMRLYR